MQILGKISDLEEAFVFSSQPEAHKDIVAKARRLYDKYDTARYDFDTKSVRYYIDIKPSEEARD